uniref:Uncharacterized protein n=1 Tax=Anguilla anguilla TaxID=7936 RepID=A0A0E9QUP0_ANGAN
MDHGEIGAVETSPSQSTMATDQ